MLDSCTAVPDKKSFESLIAVLIYVGELTPVLWRKQRPFTCVDGCKHCKIVVGTYAGCAHHLSCTNFRQYAAAQCNIQHLLEKGADDSDEIE